MQERITNGPTVKPNRSATNELNRPLYPGDSPGPCRLSLVLPVRDGQEAIAQPLQEAHAVLSAVAADHEIIVVDDAGGDHTAEIVRLLAHANPRVRLLRHREQRGPGAALRAGLEAARFELVAFAGAPGRVDLHGLASLLPLTRQHAVACSHRTGRPQGPAAGRLLCGGYNLLARLLLGSPVRGVNGGLRLFRRDALRLVLPESDGLFAHAEMLARAGRQGLSVVEVGVHGGGGAIPQGTLPARELWRALAGLVRFWWSRVVFPARQPGPARFGLGSWLCLLALLGLAVPLLFAHLAYPLVEPDEARYAEIGREMLRSGDWLVPRLNHEPHYDKPPLLHWSVASSLGLFGVHPWSARLVPAVSALLTVLATFIFAGRALGPRAGFLAGLALALMVGYVECGRFVLTDGVLVLWQALALFTAYEAVRRRRLRRSWWLASAVCCTLGVLAKGPVAVLGVGVPVAAFAWLNPERARPRLGHWLLYGGVVLGLAAPWFVAVTVRDPGFARHFFLEHHLRRFFGPDYHPGPWWFYLPVLAVGCLPWSLLFVPCARFLCSRDPAHGRLRPQAAGFFLLWAGWWVLFFSLSRGKLPTYILPALPAVAVLFGWFLDVVLFQAPTLGLLRSARRHAPRQTAMILAALWLGMAAWGWWSGLFRPAGGYVWMVVASGGCLAAVLAALVVGRNLPPRAAWTLCAVAGAAFALGLGHGLVPAWSARRSPLAQIGGLLNTPGLGLVSHGEEWGSVAFGVRDEVHFCPVAGCRPEELRRFIAAHARCLVVGKDTLDAATVRTFLPPGKAVVRTFRTGKAQAFVVGDAER